LTARVAPEFTVPLVYAVAHSEPESFTDAALHSLTAFSTLDPIGFPANATVNRATLLMLLSMENYDGVVQIITIALYFRKAGDAWGTPIAIEQHKFTIPAIARHAIIVPILAEVTGDLQVGGDAVYEVRIDVQASSANRMDYIQQGILAVSFSGG